MLNDLGQTVLLTVEEEFTTPLPEIVLGDASDRGTCYQRSMVFLATPSSQ